MGFTRGQPDWSGSSSRGYTGFGGSDLEVAARQNWVFAHAFRGEVHYYEPFEAANLHWFGGGANGGSTPTLDASYANSGENSVLFNTGILAGGQSYMNRVLSAPFHPRIGIGGFWSFTDNGGQIQYNHEIEVDNVSYDFRIRYDTDTYDVSVLDATLTPVVVGNVPWEAFGENDFIFIQMVVDLSTGKYVRVVVGGKTIEVDETAHTSAGTSNDHVGVWFAVTCKTGVASAVRLDDVIVTRNEQ